jgi:hypothetical protein
MEVIAGKVYPYRKPDGRYSILEATDRADARQYLKSCYGRGVRFCEAGAENLYRGFDSWEMKRIAEPLLAKHRNFVT